MDQEVYMKDMGLSEGGPIFNVIGNCVSYYITTFLDTRHFRCQESLFSCRVHFFVIKYLSKAQAFKSMYVIPDMHVFKCLERMIRENKKKKRKQEVLI